MWDVFSIDISYKELLIRESYLEAQSKRGSSSLGEKNSRRLFWESTGLVQSRTRRGMPLKVCSTPKGLWTWPFSKCRHALAGQAPGFTATSCFLASRGSQMGRAGSLGQGQRGSLPREKSLSLCCFDGAARSLPPICSPQVSCFKKVLPKKPTA